MAELKNYFMVLLWIYNKFLLFLYHYSSCLILFTTRLLIKKVTRNQLLKQSVHWVLWWELLWIGRSVRSGDFAHLLIRYLVFNKLPALGFVPPHIQMISRSWTRVFNFTVFNYTTMESICLEIAVLLVLKQTFFFFKGGIDKKKSQINELFITTTCS